VLTLEAEFPGGREIFTNFGQRHVTAEEVAERALAQVQEWEALDVPVGDHLADQLLIPMVLAQGGAFRTGAPSLHTRTNADIVQRFVPVPIRFEPEDPARWRITVGG
jgi:RNA 3'-terminal phosphate cyclase (ATP)